MFIFRVIAFLFVVLIAGCTPTCVDNACACNPGLTCDFGSCKSVSKCLFDCETGSTCSGTCLESCHVTCNGKSCTHTVPAGSDVECTTGTCQITCTGKCTVSGSADRINLTCGGGTSANGSGCS